MCTANLMHLETEKSIQLYGKLEREKLKEADSKYGMQFVLNECVFGFDM